MIASLVSSCRRVPLALVPLVSALLEHFKALDWTSLIYNAMNMALAPLALLALYEAVRDSLRSSAKSPIRANP